MIVGIYKMHTKKIYIKNQVHYHYKNLIESKKLENRNVLINKKSYRNLVIYFTRYHSEKSVTILNLYYDELIGKIEQYEGKKYLMADDYTQDKAWDKIKRVDIEKRDDVRILINTDDKLPDGITLKNAMILMTCVIKDGGNFYPQLVLEHALYDQ